MCIGYFPEKKKSNSWKRVFSVLQKAVSAFVQVYKIFHVSPRKKAVSSSPRKKAVSAEIVLFFSLFIITFIINQVLLFSTCIQGGPKITERHTSGNKDIK